MKNIFKFMGIALMATSLLVACKNDPEEEDPIDTTPGEVNPPAPQQGTLEITWNGQAQEIGDIIAKADNTYLESEDGNNPYVLQIDACKGVDNNGDIIFPEFIAAFAAMPNGKMYAPYNVPINLSYQGQTIQTTLEELLPTEVYETAGIQLGNTLYADYQFYGPNAQPMFSDFDATRLIANCEVNYKFASFGDVIAALQAFTFDTTGMAAQLANNDSTIYKAYLEAASAAEEAAITNATKKDMVMKLTNYIFTTGKIQ